MKPHHPYVQEAWDADRAAEASGVPLSCPDCLSSDWFHPVAAPLSGGLERHYRACKRCGFWQEADGTPAYRTWQSTHKCVAQANSQPVCAHCGTTVAPDPATGLLVHPCGKYLLPTEDGYVCATCGCWQGVP